MGLIDLTLLGDGRCRIVHRDSGSEIRSSMAPEYGSSGHCVGSPDAVALGLQPGERFVKLFIHDPEHLDGSGFKLEGRGKHMRHIKFSEPPVERRAELVGLMRIPVDRRS